MDEIYISNIIFRDTPRHKAFENKMLKEFLESLEDHKRPLLGPNYWLLKKLGMILPSEKLNRIIYIIIHEIVLFFVFTQYMELVVVRSDLDLLLNNLKITMQSSLCVIKANTFVLWQDKWKKIIDYVTEADVYERNNRDTMKGKILDVYTNYCHWITYVYGLLVLITSSTVASTPLIIFLSSSSYREELKNGTASFPHFFSSWVPFDKNRSPGCWVTVLWQVACCVYGASVLTAYDTTIIVIMVFFGGKLELIRERGKEIFGSVDDGISNEEARRKMRELHNMHVQLTKHSRLFNSVLSPVMFVYVVVCSLILCASAFQLTSATNATQKILMAVYFIFGISQLFIFCWHSNDTLLKSQNVTYGPYESKWWAASVQERKSVHILAGQFQISYIFKAGPFSNLTLSTCITILKGAYSYYTLLRK